MPAPPLPAEHPQPGRRLAPAHRLGHEHDPVILPAFPQVVMQPDDEFGVLADGVVRHPADLDDQVAAEDAERAGDDDQPAEPGPAGPSHEERAQILDHLDAQQPRPGHAHVDDTATDHLGAVGDAHHATARGHPQRVVAERLGH